MNSNKISFIICTNDESALHECEIYIQQLEIPAGFTVNILPIRQASSMAEGYNTGMLQSDAKYKVYLHQDVLILNRHFLQDTISIFQNNPQIGMIGMVGTKQLHTNGCMWSNPMRTGAIRSHFLSTSDDYFDIPIPQNRTFTPVEAIDGLLMMTQQDILWRSDLFTGWDFYDISQSKEFTRAGYRIAVPYQDTPWVLHDSGFMNLEDYHKYRKKYLEEYHAQNQVEIDACARFIATSQDTPVAPKLSEDNAVSTLLTMIDEQKYEDAFHFSQENLSQNQDNELFCILTLFLQIFQQETIAGIHEIFAPLENGDFTAAAWLPKHYARICRYLWRIEYNLPEEFQKEAQEYFTKWHVSEIARNRIHILCIPE